MDEWNILNCSVYCPYKTATALSAETCTYCSSKIPENFPCNPKLCPIKVEDNNYIDETQTHWFVDKHFSDIIQKYDGPWNKGAACRWAYDVYHPEFHRKFKHNDVLHFGNKEPDYKLLNQLLMFGTQRSKITYGVIIDGILMFMDMSITVDYACHEK